MSFFSPPFRNHFSSRYTLLLLRPNFGKFTWTSRLQSRYELYKVWFFQTTNIPYSFNGRARL